MVLKRTALEIAVTHGRGLVPHDLLVQFTLSDSSEVLGGLAGGVTPVPIPNTEVKPSKADDTAAVRQWDSRTLPGYKKSLLEKSGRLFYFVRPRYCLEQRECENCIVLFGPMITK